MHLENTVIAIGRREFLKSISASVAGLAAVSPLLLAEDPPRKKQARRRPSGLFGTFTYKTVGDEKLQADVYRPADGSKRPVLVWIHGGALVMGDRGGVDGRIKELFLPAGYTIVSIDYRLAPETKLAQIIEDVRDAFTWLHDKGPELFGADTRLIAVAGGSAGGYLTLMTGFCVTPRPAALVSLWGYGDILGAWETKPNEQYRKGHLVTKEEAESGLRTGNRGQFYMYCRQTGLLTKEVSGIDNEKEPARLFPYCPVKNVTQNYPATLFIHGTNDIDVPHAQSVEMDELLAKSGVEHKLISIPNAGHGLGGGDSQLIKSAYKEALAFVDRHVKA
jgi:acetyl esterase/lipase